jgi:predicted regulator of Ras-like GTPase activity (Roadblock/LC7/MglB family)
MSFATHVQSVVSEVPGALACSVMGFDGIAVETHQLADADPLELTSVWIEYSGVLTQLKTATETLKTGAVNEVTINTEKCVMLARVVSPEYFLILAMKPEGNFGKGRYVLRITAPKVKAEL